MADVFDLLAPQGTRKILKALSTQKQMRYSELVALVGFSAATTRALRIMEKMEIVEKKALTEPYRPVVYWLKEPSNHNCFWFVNYYTSILRDT